METPLLERIRTDLIEKRDGLTEWLRITPSDEKGILLGPSTEQGVHAHLGLIDNSITKAETGTLGQCEVCQESDESNRVEFDYTSCVCITHFSEEEVRLLENELELAQGVQKQLLPQELPNIPNMEIAAFSRPAQIIGGDYFDFSEFESGNHCLSIADVAGHGVSASLNMASIQAILRAIVPMNHSPADVVRKINKMVLHNVRFTTYVTFFIGAFDPATKKFNYCNAGHNPPMVLRARENGKESIAWLNSTGAAIGLVEGAEFGEKTFDFHEGDLLVMYTDGVTEVMNTEKEEFGNERLAAIINRFHQSSPKEVIRGIRDGLEYFSGGERLSDDITVVVCRFT
jgi:sigma-B regulation protein RsbU (phosphoserine phosphatase)